MSEEAQPAPRTSAFQWNAGGWIGAQIGCTLWIVLLGVLIVAQEPVGGAICLVGGIGLNVLGLYLWSACERVSAYAGLMILLTAVSVVNAGVIAMTHALDSFGDAGVHADYRMPWALILLAPGLMAWFWFMQSRARRGGA